MLRMWNYRLNLNKRTKQISWSGTVKVDLVSALRIGTSVVLAVTA